MEELEKIGENELWQSNIHTCSFLKKLVNKNLFFFFISKEDWKARISPEPISIPKTRNKFFRKTNRKDFCLLGTNKCIPGLSRDGRQLVNLLLFFSFTWSHRKHLDAKIQAKVPQTLKLKPYRFSKSCSGATGIFGPPWKQIRSYTVQRTISKMLPGRLSCLQHSNVWRVQSIINILKKQQVGRSSFV